MYCSRQLLQQLGKVSKDSSCIIFPVGDTACEIIRTEQIILKMPHLLHITVSNKISSNNYLVGGIDMVVITRLVTGLF